MPDSKKIEFFKAIISIAYVDGKLDPREKQEIERLINILELTEEEEKLIRGYLKEPLSMGKIKLSEHDKEEGIMLYEYACRMVLADGKIDPRELYILSKIKEYFNLSAEEVARAEQAAKENL